MTIVLATGNAGKIREFERLLEPLGERLAGLDEFGISSPEETGLTFVENALLKARHAATECGLPAIADDSGLTVPSLGGEPGIFSARYAGADATDADNNRKLVAALGGKSAPAFFYSAIVYLQHAADPTPVIVTAAWHGTFISEPKGDAGFGYDPHFFVESHGCTAAELEPAEKNRISHRGLAAAQLLTHLQRGAEVGGRHAPAIR